MNTQSVRLDVSKDVIVQQPVIIAQGDKNGTTITATIYDNGTLLTQSGLTARFKMRLPDGRHFYSKPATWTASTGTASVSIDETQAASVAGTTHEAYFELLSGETAVYSTSRFTVRVLRSATEAASTARSYDDRIDAIIADAQSAADAASAANAAATAANSAATSANSAATAANSAKTAANNAAISANSAANSAMTAAGNANTAATNASNSSVDAASAAISARSAASQATSAAASANSAASDATTAASSATSAASAANTAAGDASTAATAANSAAADATSAAASANDATTSATDAATAANDAATSANDAADRAEDAIEAIGDISELAVPLMSETTRGGARLGHGLAIEDGALGIGEVTDPTDAGPIVELTAKGWAEQDTTVDPPSPSPSYPQEIRVCRGRNLLPNTATAQTINGVTFTVNADGSVTANGTATSNADFVVHGSTTPLAASSGTYTVSGLPNDGSGTTYRIVFYCRNNQSTVIVDRLINTQSSTFTVSEDIATVYYGIRIISGYTCNNLVFKPQLEAGSTAHPYVPYGHVGVDIDIHALGVVHSNKYITTNGTVSDNSSSVFSCITGIPVNAGETYAIFLNTSADSASTIRAMFYDENETPIGSAVGYKVTDTLVSVTAPANAHTLGFTYATADTPQLIAKTIPIPLPSRGWVAALPDGTADTLTLDGAGGYVWEMATGEYTVTGNETVSSPTDLGDNYYRIALLNVLSPAMRSKAYDSSKTGAGLCTHSPFKYAYSEKSAHAYFDGMSAVLYSDGGSGAQVLADFTGASILYPLATPTTESGYVDSMPTVPAHATLTCPDLTDIAVRCCADEGAAEISAAWGRRYEERIAALEEIVANLI